MKRIITICLLAVLAVTAKAQEFNQFFVNKTLRVDYIFTGDAVKQSVCVDELSQFPTWAGRRHQLSGLPQKGNGQIYMKDLSTGQVIYATSFSSLFQEWLSTDEAQTTAKGFENTFLLPFPKQPVEVEITLTNLSQQPIATLKHTVRPDDILIRQRGMDHVTPHKYVLKSGNEADCIDVAILAEGYTENEMEQFYKDAEATCESIFSYEPFTSTRNRFNIVAVASPSVDSGVSIPNRNVWKQTAFQSHYDTFYSQRYLTSSRVKSIHNALAGIPYEHIIIIVNTPEYGGGGIYNAYTLTSAHHPTFRPVVAHEFGHSFAGLGDEYFYDNDVMTDSYPLDVEPWEPNITTRIDFASKWQDMLPAGTPIPTPPAMAKQYPVGVYEGGGYSSKGIYRPADNCRMRTNDHPDFCPVCQRAIQRIIDFYTLK